ncbi:hypothetical protein EW639_03890 [Porphyromonas gingivalis]|nr:hypothetical protein EW639_03890 [Porphyromonas gingivalis]
MVPKIFTSRSKRKVFSRHVFSNRIPAFSRTTKEKRCLAPSVTSDTWRMPYRVGQKCLPLGQL